MRRILAAKNKEEMIRAARQRVSNLSPQGSASYSESIIN
jgi:hypothetical protein